jgi:dihydrofolate reductase
VSVIGGAEIFALFLPLADWIELTEIEAEIPGDTVMLDPRASASGRSRRGSFMPGDCGQPPFAFVTLQRTARA